MAKLITKILRPDTGKAVIVALDHGLQYGILEGFENPRLTLLKVLNGEPDGVRISGGFLYHFHEELMKNPNLKKIITPDVYDVSITNGEMRGIMQDQLFSVSEMVRLGADALDAFLILGRKDPLLLEKNMKYLARIIEEAHNFGIPVLIEPLPSEFAEKGIRLALELGADGIECPYISDMKRFALIVENSPIPILIAGGAKKDPKEVFQMVKEAQDAGAKGVIFGRNIWQHKNPAGMIKGIKEIVHNKASIEKALEILQKQI